MFQLQSTFYSQNQYQRFNVDNQITWTRTLGNSFLSINFCPISVKFNAEKDPSLISLLQIKLVSALRSSWPIEKVIILKKNKMGSIKSFWILLFSLPFPVIRLQNIQLQTFLMLTVAVFLFTLRSWSIFGQLRYLLRWLTYIEISMLKIPSNPIKDTIWYDCRHQGSPLLYVPSKSIFWELQFNIKLIFLYFCVI